MSEPIVRQRILLLDSDIEARTQLRDLLSRHEYEVYEASSVSQMDRLLGRTQVDAVLMDLMLPGETGLQVCGRLRSRSPAPGVIVVSAVADETDIVVGLEIGADDYVAKPYRSRELLARVRSVLRRRQEANRQAVDRDLTRNYRFEGWRLITATHQLFDPQGRAVDLSSAEFTVLRALLSKPQEVVARNELVAGARNGDARASDLQLNVAMSRLRAKLARGQGGDHLIRTVRYAGYLFTAPVERFADD